MDESVFRGYKERKLRKQETEMAIKIQRIYRRHSSIKKALSEEETDATPVEPEAAPVVQEPLPACPEEQPKTSEEKVDPILSRDQLSSQSKAVTKKHLVGVGEKTKEEFLAFQDEITELKWYAEQQLERALCGHEFVGPRIVLVSSKIPKGQLLAKIVRKDVLIFVYDFNNDSFDVLLENIRVNLEAFKQGCKARSICLYCQGGPGYMYIRRAKVVTVAKLKKDCEQDQVRFFKELGKYLTKKEPQRSVIHVMGCNILGNEKGQELFDYLRDLIKPNQARFEAPLELSEAGADMIDMYFDFNKYTVWRAHKHSKLDPEL
ncbi:NMDA receptor synaptonuclear signaling and neuronal migration factor-like isoform X2 [Acanthaster planci]|uniref:NMDA receptor synaptonuclear signaling and neuronal migration factor-like isoform X2 n=1 Tax=Acanthaster planci TaxID=133434 RepID=A0A8B7XWA5_ACAPL|nr:NMDA receptor synaptonuclear signaling and neuronal migration factor-like isoform X2 [Acanthaster planci]